MFASAEITPLIGRKVGVKEESLVLQVLPCVNLVLRLVGVILIGRDASVLEIYFSQGPEGR